MITQDHVDLVLSPYGTSLTMTASDVTESHGYVMLAATASGAQIWEKGYSAVFGVYAPAGRYFIGFSDLMARNGFKTIGLVFENSPFNLSLARGVRKWIKRFNISITHDMGFNDAQTEFPRILEQLLATPHDGLIFSGYPRECHQFIDLMKKPITGLRQWHSPSPPFLRISTSGSDHLRKAFSDRPSGNRMNAFHFRAPVNLSTISNDLPGECPPTTPLPPIPPASFWKRP